ncbi:hypothetical protein B566_EDAN005410 [Ephemera danica]|nr:hypothetical protein B566_EDAN005410 [Ephemera danica]
METAGAPCNPAMSSSSPLTCAPEDSKTLLSYLPKRQALDLSFRDIRYKVLAISLNKKPEIKEILHGISGDFQAGQLTAILGPSGAGKSTLLNILAGYTARGVNGNVLVNGAPRDPRRFSRQSCYIMQENELRPLLTAREAMGYAAQLKLSGGPQAPSWKALQLQIQEILETLGLNECQDTRAGQLSGGQRRRLSIALELLNNPPIMFLDEPTTGLDSASCTHCIELLRFLARGGRTVVITIHQPSARLFENFDQLYGVAEGRCIYRGAPQQLVPFLATQGLLCPAYHNPADFLLEVASGQHGEHGLAEAAEQQQPVQAELPVTASITLKRMQSPGEIPAAVPEVRVNNEVTVSGGRRCSPFKQFWLLYVRNLHILRRDFKEMSVRYVCHITIAFLFGYLYRGVGSDADSALANWVYIYGSNMFLMYTGQMAVTLSFPLEMKVLTREHFNKWYSLVPYLGSIMSIEIPFQVISALSYLGISYCLTGQPLEMSRAIPFCCLCILMSLTAQGFGFFIGATLPVSWLFHISYFRAAFQAAVFALYGSGRANLDCQQIYCHFRYPQKFLTEMNIPPDIDMLANAGFIVAVGAFVHVLTYVALWIRLHKR